MSTEHTGKTYQIRTIADIYKNVPADRIQLCMTELGAALSQAASIRDLLFATAEQLTGQKIDASIELPEAMEWIDDGKGELDLKFVTSKDDEFISLHTKIGGSK
jgi:hypothetical protein